MLPRWEWERDSCLLEPEACRGPAIEMVGDIMTLGWGPQGTLSFGVCGKPSYSPGSQVTTWPCYWESRGHVALLFRFRDTVLT